MGSEAPWLALLDRELAVSAFCHDARGPLTALDGACELASAPDNSALRLATRRLVGLVEELSVRKSVGRREELVFGDRPFGPPVVLSGEPTPLYISIKLAHLPPPVCTDRGQRVALQFEFERPNGPTEWTLALVLEWLDQGGRSLDIARVRVAAKMLGGSSILEETGPARALLTLLFQRANPKEG